MLIDVTLTTTQDGGAGSMIGTKLNGRYEVLEHLGEGATATVYKGLDSLLGREVALKILLPHVRDSTRKRFFQEAMAAARLNHPNIMAIHDRGEDKDRHYLVIEYVDGQPLTSYIPSSPQVVVTLGAQIARALDYAHERDIIHRDIKPANIKVTTTGQVKIMDLGLARPRDGKRVTAPGMVIGTPAYISPEQAQGLELDRHTDIYSLGIVLYEMATGQLPFNADDITALMLQHVQQPVPPPRTLVPDLPMALERYLRSLEKQASRRYQTGRSRPMRLKQLFPL
ncbi:serine/threonine protein kinase [bacterium]|nr:serine/threonine protein kinase [bacterium]